MNMPITKQRIRNHFHYSFWIYALMIALALFGWNLIYTMTRYRPPESLKVDLYAEAYYGAEEAAQGLMDKIHAEVMPEMEEVDVNIMTFDDTYGDMQMMVWISAGEGDVYLLSKSRFDSVAADGAMLELQPLIDSGAINVDGIDLTNGYGVDSDTKQKVLCGIPTDTLVGLGDYGLPYEDMVLAILYNNQNDEYTLKMFNYLLDNMKTSTAAPAAE